MPLVTTSECLSDLALDEWLGQALDAPASNRIGSHVRDCLRCRLRKELLEQEHAAFLARVPNLNAHTKLVSRARKRMPPRLWLLSVAAVAALAWVAPTHEVPGVRTKGGASLGFFIKRGESVTRGTSGATVQPGDWLRFTYSTDRSVYFALLNRDPHGARVYFPWSLAAAPLAAAYDRALDFSVELDDSLGPERVYAIFCPRSFEVAGPRAELENTGELRAPEGCQLQVVKLRKEAAP